jgi:hypothetical protein
MLRRPYVVVVAALAMALGLVDPASAASGPDRVTADLDVVFTAPGLSQACGTEVIITITGTSEITLWRNEAGLVTRELDRTPGAFQTWSAPETGQSVKIRADLVSHWDYGDGAVVGGPVTFSFTGIGFHVPGAGDTTVAGRELAVGDVDGFEDGVPIVDDGTLVRFSGHIADFDFVDALCGLLT